MYKTVANADFNNMQRAYLLTPMDYAMLPYAKLTILCCTSSVITRQQALRAIFKAHSYTDCHLSVISTCILGKAQTPILSICC